MSEENARTDLFNMTFDKSRPPIVDKERLLVRIFILLFVSYLNMDMRAEGGNHSRVTRRLHMEKCLECQKSPNNIDMRYEKIFSETVHISTCY